MTGPADRPQRIPLPSSGQAGTAAIATTTPSPAGTLGPVTIDLSPILRPGTQAASSPAPSPPSSSSSAYSSSSRPPPPSSSPSSHPKRPATTITTIITIHPSSSSSEELAGGTPAAPASATPSEPAATGVVSSSSSTAVAASIVSSLPLPPTPSIPGANATELCPPTLLSPGTPTTWLTRTATATASVKGAAPVPSFVGAVAGAAAGTVLLLAALAALWWWYAFRRGERGGADGSGSSGNTQSMGAGLVAAHSRRAARVSRFSLDSEGEGGKAKWLRWV